VKSPIPRHERKLSEFRDLKQSSQKSEKRQRSGMTEFVISGNRIRIQYVSYRRLTGYRTDLG